jgi:hypothetical protein
MKKTILIFGTLLFGVFAMAQQMQPVSVSNGGGNMNTNAIQAGYTIGEPVTGPISNGSVTFTQGFQQNYLVAPDAINEWGKPRVKVSVSPNPSTGIFNIHHTTLSGFSWEVTDIHGSILATGNGKGSEFYIDLSSHPKGIYYLKITHEETQTVKKLVLQ